MGRFVRIMVDLLSVSCSLQLAFSKSAKRPTLDPALLAGRPGPLACRSRASVAVLLQVRYLLGSGIGPWGIGCSFII
jgi:hypothetical protein